MGKEVHACAALVGVAALVTLTTGCDAMAYSQLDFSTTERVAITEIRIEGGSGDVTIRGIGPAGQVRVNRAVHYRGSEPDKTYRLSGTVLHISTNCGRLCHVSYDIQAPPGVAIRGENGSGDLTLTDVAIVDLRLGSGDITVTDSSADVEVHTGSGDISVSAVAGALVADTGSGSIEAQGVSRGPARIRTGSGDLTLSLSLPGSVRARTGSGDIGITVPPGSYRVQASSGSGKTNLGVPNDPAAKNLLELDSGSGDITLRRAANSTRQTPGLGGEFVLREEPLTIG